MLSVPVDYSKPDGDVAQLAMIRFKATGDKIGSLVSTPAVPANPVSNRPSASSATHAAIRAGAFRPRRLRPARSRRLDARGVVQLRRRQRPAAGRPEVDYTPEGVAHIDSETKEFVQRCVDKSGKEFLANVGTASVVKDLDAIRAALGDDKLTYLGYSYGTRIGSAYAEEFPQNVRAMILDGAIDPNADPIEADIRQAAAFQKAFDDYAADCAKDPNCPLGTDPAKADDVYKSMVEPLVDKPAKTQDPRGLSYSDARRRHHPAAVLAEPLAPSHRRALTELKEGRGDTMLRLADLYMGRDLSTGTTTTRPTCASPSTASTSRDHRPGQARRQGPPGPRGRRRS